MINVLILRLTLRRKRCAAIEREGDERGNEEESGRGGSATCEEEGTGREARGSRQ